MDIIKYSHSSSGRALAARFHISIEATSFSRVTLSFSDFYIVKKGQTSSATEVLQNKARQLSHTCILDSGRLVKFASSSLKAKSG